MTLKVVWCDFVVISVDLLPCGDPWSLVVYSIGGDQFCAVWRLVVVHGSYICICDTHTHTFIYILQYNQKPFPAQRLLATSSRTSASRCFVSDETSLQNVHCQTTH